MPNPTPWTDERIELLKVLWPHHSAPECAIELLKLPGPESLPISAASVIGKAHRLKLASKLIPKGPVKSKPVKAVKEPIKEPKPPKLSPVGNAEGAYGKPGGRKPPAVVTHDDINGGIAAVEVKRGQCRWVLGTPRQLVYCGKEVWRGAWCEEHYRRVFRPRFEDSA